MTTEASPASTPPRVWPLYAAGFVTAFGANGIAAAVGAQHEQLGLSLAWFGVFLALYDVAELILKPIFGALSDRIGPKPLIIGGLIVFVLASVGGIIASGPVWLGLVRLAQGAGASAFSPSSSAAVARLTSPAARGKYFGRYGSWKSLGYAGGPVIGALIVTTAGTPWLFAVLAVLAAATAAAVAVLIAPILPLPRERATVSQLVRALTHPSFLIPVMVLAVGSAAIGALTGMLPALGAALGIPFLASAAAVAAIAITSAIVQPIAGRAHDVGRLAVRGAGSGGALIVAAGFIVLALLPGTIAMFAAAALVGVGVAVLTPVAFSHLAAITPAARLGRTMGTAELGREAGDAVGPLVVGGVASVLALPAGFGVFALLAVAVSISAAIGLRQQQTPGLAERPQAE